MISLGVVAAVCMAFVALSVWRIANRLLGPGDGEGPGDGGRDPMDLPGDGMSPHDLFLRALVVEAGSLPPPPVDNRFDRPVAPGQ
jgi:hypothetical protein